MISVCGSSATVSACRASTASSAAICRSMPQRRRTPSRRSRPGCRSFSRGTRVSTGGRAGSRSSPPPRTRMLVPRSPHSPVGPTPTTSPSSAATPPRRSTTSPTASGSVPTMSSSPPSSNTTPICCPGPVSPGAATSSVTPRAPLVWTPSRLCSTSSPTLGCLPSPARPTSPAGSPRSTRSSQPPTTGASR